MNLCPTCRKLLYRTDACKGIDVSECGRTDGGARKFSNHGGNHESGRITEIPNSSTEAAKPLGLSAVVIENDDLAAGADSRAGGSSVVPVSDVEPVALTIRGTPRKRAPKGTGFDRKTYQRVKAKERRARLKQKPRQQ